METISGGTITSEQLASLLVSTKENNIPSRKGGGTSSSHGDWETSTGEVSLDQKVFISTLCDIFNYSILCAIPIV
jgi:hypothetical protein